MVDLRLGAGNALVVVAHPDDEVIWMGGMILDNPKVKWTIFSLCRSDDPDRAPKFKGAAKHLGARGIISDLEDKGRMNIKDSVAQIKRRIMKMLGPKNFTYIFTHGYNGEYGHPRHKGVHRAVNELLCNKQLITKNLFYFSYKLDNGGEFAVPDKESSFKIQLKPKTFGEKKEIVESLYGFNRESFEYKSCSKIETFKSGLEIRVIGD